MGLPKLWHWVNYSTALNDGGILRYFINSIIYSGLTVIIVSILTAMAAYAIARMQWKLKNVIFAIFTIGIMVPTQAALLPLFQVLDKMGLKGGYLGLLIPYIAFGIPMSVMILTGFYKGIPKEMEEAAYIDGCNIIRCFVSIMIPMIKPPLATAAIFTFLGSWNELLFANTLVDSQAYRTLPVGIMSFAGQYATNWGLIGAGMVIATLPTIVVYFFFSNQVQESLIAGALKG
jgi:raffinose/stachyose/melibiose transport system permease protein